MQGPDGKDLGNTCFILETGSAETWRALKKGMM